MSALAGAWLWSDARFLWLLPLALLPLLAARPRRVTVGSTALWRSLPGRRAPRPPLLRVIAIAALIVAAAGPARLADPGRDGLSAELAGAELALRRIDGAFVVDHGPSAAGGIRIESERGEPWGESAGGRAGSIVLPASAAGGRGRVIAPGRPPVAFAVPPAPPPPRVRDESASPAVARALAALAETGRIAIHGATAASAATVLIASDGDPAAGDLAAGRIILPSAAGERPRVLPVPAAEGAPWLAGLAPERFTILAAVELDAGNDTAHEVALADRDGAALIAEGPGAIRFAFRPEQSDLPGRAEWPVLLGRAIERLAPEPIAPVPSSRLPALLAALLALGLWPFAARSRRERVLGVLAIAAALAVPPLPILAPGRVPLGDGPPASALARAAARLRGGGTIEVTPERALPLEEERIAALLAARRAGLAILPGEAPALAAAPASLPLGAAATIAGAGGHAGEVMAFSPEGGATAIGVVAPGSRVSHRPDRPGLWLYRSPGAATAAVEVVAPLALVAIGAEETGAAELCLGSGLFRAEGTVDGAALLPPLPARPEESIAVWEGADPRALSAGDAARLRAWLEAGGTLFAVAAPPFRGAESATALDELLPLPLPAPPRPPERDHGVLLLDLSGSVAGTELAVLWSGVVALVEGAPHGDRLAIAGFRDDCRWILPPGRPLEEGALERVRGALAAGGGTRLDLALAFAREAIASRADLAPRILVITDGRSAGADFGAIGRGLAEAGIALSAVRLGSAPDGADPGLAILGELCAAAGGELRSAHDAADAVRILGEAIDPPRDSWRESGGVLRAAGVFAEGWPGAIEGPRRRLESPAEVAAGVRAALVDGAGKPIAWSRDFGRDLGGEGGRGRAILLWSGLDDESLPDRRAAERFRGALAAALARAVRGAPVERRDARVRIDAEGAPRLLVDRAAGDPPAIAARAIAADGSASAASAATYEGRWVLDGVDPARAAAAIELGEDADGGRIRSTPSTGEPERGAAAWRALAARLPPPPERGELHPERLLLALIALVAAAARAGARSPGARGP